jgi:hypothetical protein
MAGEGMVNLGIPFFTTDFRNWKCGTMLGFVAADDHGRRLGMPALEARVELPLSFLGAQGDAVEAGNEIDMPEVAAELAVGDRRQAEVFLQLHHLADLAIFLALQVRGRLVSETDLLAQLVQLARTQQAADVVGAKRSLHAAYSR